MKSKTKNILKLAALLIIIHILPTSCKNEDAPGSISETEDALFNLASGESTPQGAGQNNQSGLITAGEWSDLNNWNFWNNLLDEQDFVDMPDYWSFYTNNRVSLLIKNGGIPIIDAKVELLKGNSSVWQTKTDNFGKAELWIGLNQKESISNLNNFSLKINEQTISVDLNLYQNGLNELNLNLSPAHNDKVEISFVVDATGSMGDELEFLKSDLKSVIQKVKIENPNIDIYTSTVFYRDIDDDYLVKKSDFTADINRTINFISQQRADGGGDFPEAVHTALNTGITELQWSSDARTRIIFLLLDAPPHYLPEVITDIHDLAKKASAKGIKIIPIAASGIDKETEFLMRFLSMTTNGTYVFITNDSGIGNDHLIPSVGDYQVELLNDLMVRLIKKYSE